MHQLRSPGNQREQGMPDATNAPAALRATKKARKQVTTGTPKQSGIPCAMVLRLASCSRRSAGLDSLRRPGFMTRGLIPASGDHDHTTSPSASGLRSSAQPGRPSHPAPRFVTIAKRPPCERGMARPYNCLYFRKSEIFSPGGLDTISENQPSGKSAQAAPA